MNTKRFGLISILAVGLIIAGVLAFQPLNAGKASAAPSKAPVGSWIVTLEISGQPQFIDVATFHSDNTMTVVENGVVGTGVWEKISADRYAFTAWILFDPDLDPIVYRAKVVSTIQVSQDGEQYTGPFVSSLYDQDGNLIVAVEGAATGERMQLERMP